ncbi:hypothetical protein [Methylopila sp. Yamaguchi]|uniref:hypothetical protein n=1 Tax=Methylopila sp. Yamaguchi TaxID=1437817 RepID=UPI000CC0B29D|nr:hypothetical protein [Methylopila sp. Yamaguchi]GBD49407.1 hypothetical protein METY_2620 [Methylopila sp. Yamaguchi]
MTSVRKFIVAGACALGVALGAMPAEAASSSAKPASATSIAGIRSDQIMLVDRRGGRGWGGGGRHYGGWGGGGRHYGGWGGGGRRYYGGGWGGRRYYGYRRHHNYGGYAAAGVIGLATGALIAGNRGYYDDDYYYGRPTYYRSGYYRSYGGECEVITTRRGYDGRRYRVVRYRPC